MKIITQIFVNINYFYFITKKPTFKVFQYFYCLKLVQYSTFYINLQQKQAKIAHATLQSNAIGIVSKVFLTFVEAKSIDLT